MNLFDQSRNVFSGLRIMFSSSAVEQDGPRRTHQWDGKKESRQYHFRIQKKWIKRFGYKYKPCMYKTEMGIIAHPAFKSEIERVSRG